MVTKSPQCFYSEPAITGRHAHGASVSLKDTIRAFDRPSGQMSEDQSHVCVNLEQERFITWNSQSEEPLEHYNSAGQCSSTTCVGGAGSKMGTSGHASLRTSQSPMSVSTYTGLLHEMTYSPDAPSSLAQSHVPPPWCTGLVRDLNNSLGATSGISGSVMPASRCTSPLHVLSESLDHCLLSSHGKRHEQAVSCGSCHERPLTDSCEEIPHLSTAHHQGRLQQPKAIQNRAGKITTLLIRNIPMTCTNTMLINELHSQGFQGVYDFFYRPMDHHTQQHRTCAFVNSATPLIATALHLKMHGRFLRCSGDQEVPLEVIAAKVQGLEPNATHYKMKKNQKRRQIRAQPIFPAIENNRVHEVDAHARLMLLST